MEMNSSKKYLSEMGDIKQPMQRSTKISIGDEIQETCAKYLYQHAIYKSG